MITQEQIDEVVKGEGFTGTRHDYWWKKHLPNGHRIDMCVMLRTGRINSVRAEAELVGEVESLRFSVRTQYRPFTSVDEFRSWFTDFLTDLLYEEKNEPVS